MSDKSKMVNGHNLTYQNLGLLLKQQGSKNQYSTKSKTRLSKDNNND